jgi:hypothetical protein
VLFERTISDSFFTSDSLSFEGGKPQYCSVSEVRAFSGLTVSQVSSTVIADAIALWQEVVERICRLWFYPKPLDIMVDGNNFDTLRFGVPVISISAVYLNASSAVLNTTAYKVYTDLQDPRISIVHSPQLGDLYSASLSGGHWIFFRGYKNQRIVGVFGHVVNGKAPKAIKRALIKLVTEKLVAQYGSGDAGGVSTVIAGTVVSESTDGHSVTYGTVASKPRRAGLSGVTLDQEILDILALYRAPIGIATPASWSY